MAGWGDTAWPVPSYILNTYGIWSPTKFKDAYWVVSSEGLSPVKEYLGKLTWDGTTRLDTACGLPWRGDTLCWAVTRKTLVAAVAHI